MSTVFDGITRNSPEGMAFQKLAAEKGFSMPSLKVMNLGGRKHIEGYGRVRCRIPKLRSGVPEEWALGFVDARSAFSQARFLSVRNASITSLSFASPPPRPPHLQRTASKRTLIPRIASMTLFVLYLLTNAGRTRILRASRLVTPQACSIHRSAIRQSSHFEHS